MFKKRVPSKNMAVKKNIVIQCSTPNHQLDSPSRDSDSEAASPVPFLCTQDGADGETDVVWNYYSPKTEYMAKTRLKNSTPLSTKVKKTIKSKVNEDIPKRKPVKSSQMKAELFQDLIELNQNLHELIGKKTDKIESNNNPQSGSEDDIFNETIEVSPKSGLKSNSRCLRKNLLSSKFCRPEADAALESDDSMNECLIKASQIVEENILNEPSPAKKICYGLKSNLSKHKLILDQDSMDAILSNIGLDSPVLRKSKNYASPNFNNDTFDSLVGNLNDSALDLLTQMPVKNQSAKKPKQSVCKVGDRAIKEVAVHGGSPSSKTFGRYSSMPESPTVLEVNKPSTSGMVFGRYNSLPYGKESTESGDSPIRCTPDEIKRKHQQAREKLQAKRLLPFTSQQSSQVSIARKTFQPRIPSNKLSNTNSTNNNNTDNQNDMKLLIEKKRQEALMKLRRRKNNNI